MTLHPFAACEERAVVRVVLRDGTVLTGAYTSRARLHFVHRTGPALPLVGEVSGPFSTDDVHSVQIVKTHAEVLREAYVRLHSGPCRERNPSRPRNIDIGLRRSHALSSTPATIGNARCSCAANSTRPPTASVWRQGNVIGF